MDGVMMHCGAKAIPMNMLATIPTPEPTKTHFPIAHDDFYMMAEERLLDAGYEITNPQHFINKEGAQYFAMLQLRHQDEDRNAEYSTLAALRNAHDMVFRASLAVGAKVFLCDNLSFSGDIVVGGKHTANLWNVLPGRFDEAIAKIRVMRKRQDIRFAEYKEAPLDDITADHLTMECYRRGIINIQRIGKVNKQWYDPEVDHGDKKVWRFFNAVTAALGPSSNNQLIQLPKKTIDLHLLMDEFCDVDLPDENQLAEVEPEDRLGIGTTIKGVLNRIIN
jgi:hypothetical protein